MQTAIIMVGASGAGKSTWIKKNVPRAKVCSADHWFTNKEGEYNFDPPQLDKAHGACLKLFVRHLIYGKDVVCDNTNTTILELSPYVALTQAYGYATRIIVLTPGAEVCIERNNKDVPPIVVERMSNQVDELLEKWPGYWPTFELQRE